MNDRASAAPPVQFLGPDQLKQYEKQFYSDPPASPREMRRMRYQRPFSESSVADQMSSPEQMSNHRKSNSFFGRVKDVLGWNSSRNNGQKQAVARKHSSLQELPQRLSPSPSPRPEHLRAAKSHSEMYNIPQLANLGGGGGGGNRPTREDVLDSYNQLVASGFFQAHAIQSTRHAGPANRGNDRRSPLPMPPIPGSAPCSPLPPPRTSSIAAVFRSSSPQSPTSPLSKSRLGNRGWASKEEVDGRSSPTISNKDSRHPRLRGRKRSRLDTDETSGEVAASTSSSFAEPLKRVAKKLRKMPSSKDSRPTSPDGVLQLPQSKSIGGTLHFKEIMIRMRSPSPAPPQVIIRAEQRPRRSFSNSSKESNKLRKRRRSAPVRSRSTSGSIGFETWEMAGERMSIDETPRSSMDVRAESMPPPSRSREDTPLCVVPDANRGIPSVPRIPDRYHYYHKPQTDDQEGDENESADSHWQFGNAL